MARRNRTVAFFTTEIIRSITQSGIYYGCYSMTGGMREMQAAEKLKNEGRIKLVPYLNTPGRTDYVCIHPDAQFDIEKMEIIR